jgi:hypothetical protein
MSDRIVHGAEAAEARAHKTPPTVDAGGHRHGAASVPDCCVRPGEVLRDPNLSIQQKRDILRELAFDACRTEGRAMSEGKRGGMASRLDEIIDALIDLDGVEASDPSRNHRDGFILKTR